MSVEFKVNAAVSTIQFIDLLNKSTLGERRPVDDYNCMEGMIKQSNLIVTAWNGDVLIGMARSMTDFNFACYLSDLAVDERFQKRGIGKTLIRLTQEQLGKNCKLILIASPAANSYYQHIGLENNQRCWLLERDKSIF